MELLAYKASSDPDAMHYRHQEMRESDNKFVEAIQKESNAHYKVVTYKLQTIQIHYYPVYGRRRNHPQES